MADKTPNSDFGKPSFWVQILTPIIAVAVGIGSMKAEIKAIRAEVDRLHDHVWEIAKGSKHDNPR